MPKKHSPSTPAERAAAAKAKEILAKIGITFPSALPPIEFVKRVAMADLDREQSYEGVEVVPMSVLEDVAGGKGNSPAIRRFHAAQRDLQLVLIELQKSYTGSVKPGTPEYELLAGQVPDTGMTREGWKAKQEEKGEKVTEPSASAQDQEDAIRKEFEKMLNDPNLPPEQRLMAQQALESLGSATGEELFFGTLTPDARIHTGFVADETTYGRLLRAQQARKGRAGAANTHTAGDLAQWYYKMTPAERGALEDQMIRGGLMERGGDGYNAWLGVLQTAARFSAAGQQVSPQEVIDLAIARPDQGQQDTIALTDPIDLKATFQATAQNLLGQRISEDQADLFVAAYQQIERDRGRAANTKPAEATAPPSAAAYAQSWLDQKYREEEVAYGTVARMNEFYSMLGPIA